MEQQTSFWDTISAKNFRKSTYLLGYRVEFLVDTTTLDWLNVVLEFNFKNVYEF